MKYIVSASDETSKLLDGFDNTNLQSQEYSNDSFSFGNFEQNVCPKCGKMFCMHRYKF